MRGRVVVVAAQQATPSPSASPGATGTTGPTATAGAGTRAATPTAAQPATAPQTGGTASEGVQGVWLATAISGLVLIAVATGGLTVLRRR
jgi:hypothetical protein